MTGWLRFARAMVLPFLLPPIAGGGAITVPYSFSPNTTAQSGQVNSNFSTFANDYNGNINDANVASLSESKITFSGTGHDHSGGAKGALVSLPLIQGRLTFVSSTSIKFAPFNGNRLFLKKSGAWTALAMGSAGITAANTGVFVGGVAGQNLAASTTYYVYLFDNAGTTTVDFSTTTHATDTATGVEIKSGDDTRVLVGMVRTNGTSQFQYDNTLLGVLSYLNRRDVAIVNNFTADRTTTSATYIELNSEIRASFLTWADEAVAVAFGGAVSLGTTSVLASIALGVDGTNQEDCAAALNFSAAAHHHSPHVAIIKALAEGFHFVTVLGATASNTLTFKGGTFTADTTVREICWQTARVRG